MSSSKRARRRRRVDGAKPLARFNKQCARWLNWFGRQWAARPPYEFAHYHRRGPTT